MRARDDSVPAQPEPPEQVSGTAGHQSDRLAGWLTIAANLGVVLGLFILIIEVRQSAALTRLSMEVSKNALLADIELHLAEPEQAAIWIKSYRSPETMNDRELRVVESYYVAVMMQWDYLLLMEDAGLITRKRVERHIRNTAPYYFGSPFGKRWFIEEMEAWTGTPMMAIAYPIVQALDQDFLSKRAKRLRTFTPNDRGNSEAASQ